MSLACVRVLCTCSLHLLSLHVLLYTLLFHFSSSFLLVVVVVVADKLRLFTTIHRPRTHFCESFQVLLCSSGSSRQERFPILSLSIKVFIFFLHSFFRKYLQNQNKRRSLISSVWDTFDVLAVFRCSHSVKSKWHQRRMFRIFALRRNV